MAAPSQTINYDTFFTSTIVNYQKGLTKNFIESRPALEVFFDNFKHMDTGSYAIQKSVEYGQNSNTRTFDGFDVIDVTPSEFALPVQYPWRNFASSAAISRTDLIANSSSKEKLFDLFEGRIRQAVRSVRNLMGNEIYSDGTNFGGRTIIGLAAAIYTTPTSNPASGALGGIDAASNPFWRNNATTSFGSFAAYGPKGTSTDKFISTWNNCTDGPNEMPTHIFSDQTTWEYYNASNTGAIVINDPNHGTSDLSFQTLRYQGRPWYWDRQCPSGRAYFINANYHKMWVDSQMNFTWSEDRTWPNQFVLIRLLAVRVAFVHTARMFDAVLDGITA